MKPFKTFLKESSDLIIAIDWAASEGISDLKFTWMYGMPKDKSFKTTEKALATIKKMKKKFSSHFSITFNETGSDEIDVKTQKKLVNDIQKSLGYKKVRIISPGLFELTQNV